MNKAKIIVVLVAGLLFGITVALFFQAKAVEAKRVQDREVAGKVVTAIGPSLLAEAYKMPQQDYDKLMRLKNQLLKTREISDSDLSWLLALLNPAGEFVVQARVLAMMDLMGNAPASQKEMLRVALKPFVEQDDPRYRNSLKSIQKFVFGNPDWQPGQPF